MVQHEPCSSRGDCYHIRAGSIGGRIGGHKTQATWGKTSEAAEARSRAGHKSFKLYGSPATPKTRAKGGRKAVESGHLARIRELPQTKTAQKEAGRISGRKNVESGHFARIASLGRRSGGCIQGRKNVKSGHLARIAKGVPSTADGILFRSQTEAMFYCVTKELGGEPVYESSVIMLPNGKSYTPDFVLRHPVLGLPENVPIELKSSRNAYYNRNLKKARQVGAAIVYWDELVEEES